MYSNFVFKKEWYEIIKPLPDKTFLEVMDAICGYVFNDIVPDLDKASASYMAVQFIMREIDADKEKYNSICERRAEAGRKGGQSRANQSNTPVVAEPTEQPTQQEQVEQTEQNKQKQAKQANASFASTDQANQANASKCKQSQAKPSKSSEELFEIKDKDKDIGENNDFLFSQDSEHDGCVTAAEKKEKEIEEISLCYLSNGKPNAYKEAQAFYDYNDALGWERTITRQDGSEVKQRIRNRVAYGKGWKTKSEQCFAPADGVLMADIVRDIGYDKEIVNNFRGYQNKDGTTVVVLFATGNACQRFCKWIEKKDDNYKFFAAIQTSYPNAKSVTPQPIAAVIT